MIDGPSALSMGFELIYNNNRGICMPSVNMESKSAI